MKSHPIFLNLNKNNIFDAMLEKSFKKKGLIKNIFSICVFYGQNYIFLLKRSHLEYVFLIFFIIPKYILKYRKIRKKNQITSNISKFK